MRKVPVPERIRKGVTISESQCWEWKGAHTAEGYGWIRINRRTVLAHRASYETFVGPIPQGLVIDHLCRNTRCVNPAHMETVSNRENVLRGIGPSAIRAKQTHCIHGHLLAGDNLRTWRGLRTCKTCNLKHVKAYQRKKKGLK